MTAVTLAPGEHVLVQEVWRGRVWSARPMTVVADWGDTVMLWMPPGTEWRAPTVGDRGRGLSRGERTALCLETCQWGYVERSWTMETLWFMDSSTYHATWVCWSEARAHLGWYVNFQAPMTRSDGRLHYMDLALDMRVAPDGTWSFKDEDELQLLVGRGVMTVAARDRLYAEAKDVCALLEAAEGPFAERWISWQPPFDQSCPPLPEDWDQP